MAVTAADLRARTGAGRRAPLLAAGGSGAVVVGVLVVVLAGAVVAGVLAGEAVVVLGVVALGAAAVGHRRRRVDPRDLAPTGPWAGGEEATLAGTVRRPGTLAEVRREGAPLASLHRHTRGADGDEVIARLPGDGPGRWLYLEHRAEPAPFEGIGVRLVDGRGDVRAVAHLLLGGGSGGGSDGGSDGGSGGGSDGGVADWKLPLTRRTLRLRASVPRRPGAPRPTRRTFRDGAADHVVYARYRPKGWVAVLPEGLTDAETLFCLWLVHLLDAHALLGRAWFASGPDWSPVPDNFPRRIGPGGFGDPNPSFASAGSGAGSGGGT